MARRIATTLAAAPFENVIKVLPHETRSPSSSSRIPATTRLPAPPPKVHQRQRPSESSSMGTELLLGRRGTATQPAHDDIGIPDGC